MSTDKTTAAFWDSKFSGDEYLYGEEPNRFFEEQIDALPVGRLLLPAEGEGRNAVYAASKGWNVTAFDISPVAREKALNLAAKRKVEIDYCVADFGNSSLPSHSFDAAALLYAHVPAELRRPGLEAVRDALAPGGVVVIEGFSPANLELGNSFGPDQSMCYKEAELREMFADFQITLLEERKIPLDSGRHQGHGIVLRMVAHKAGN